MRNSSVLCGQAVVDIPSRTGPCRSSFPGFWSSQAFMFSSGPSGAFTTLS
jgi:hypothetical protein